MTATTKKKVRVIACGMLAREILDICRTNRLEHVSLTCLPAEFHHRPERIAPAVEKAVHEARAEGYDDIFIGYGDCGTGGMLDRVCERLGVERVAGPHCFSFYIGNEEFEAAGDAYMTTFFMTDFLARHVDTFLMKPLGLDRHPELTDIYFGGYERLLYIAQTDNPELTQRASRTAQALGLAFERRLTGYGDLTPALKRADVLEKTPQS